MLLMIKIIIEGSRIYIIIFICLYIVLYIMPYMILVLLLSFIKFDKVKLLHEYLVWKP